MARKGSDYYPIIHFYIIYDRFSEEFDEFFLQILDIGKASVDVRFYGDYTIGKISKSKLIKFESFILSYDYNENGASQKLMLRHKGIMEALDEHTVRKNVHKNYQKHKMQMNNIK